MKDSDCTQPTDVVGMSLKAALDALSDKGMVVEAVRTQPTHNRLALQDDNLYVVRQTTKTSGHIVITLAAKMSPI